jgi:hypothetical protein
LGGVAGCRLSPPLTRSRQAHLAGSRRHGAAARAAVASVLRGRVHGLAGMALCNSR